VARRNRARSPGAGRGSRTMGCAWRALRTGSQCKSTGRCSALPTLGPMQTVKRSRYAANGTCQPLARAEDSPSDPSARLRARAGPAAGTPLNKSLGVEQLLWQVLRGGKAAA